MPGTINPVKVNSVTINSVMNVKSERKNVPLGNDIKRKLLVKKSSNTFWLGQPFNHGG